MSLGLKPVSSVLPRGMDDPWPQSDSNGGLTIVLDSNGETSDGGIQVQFIRACLSNDFSTISKLLSDPMTRNRVKLDQADESGSPPILIASCFGYPEIVELLLDAGANVNAHDARGWSALMWATNNNHKSIAKILIDSGADKGAITKNGRTASDFCTDDHLKTSLSKEDSTIGAAGIGEESLASFGPSMVSGGDWYGTTSGLDFEETLREQEQSRRLALEAGMNLEVDLGALSLDPANGLAEEQNLDDDDQGFVWDHCLPSQMFVFSEASIPDIIRLAIEEYPPQRNPQQKPVPANLLFLASRFSHYFSTQKILHTLLNDSLAAIERTVVQRHDDMTILSFWISNALLLQYYLRKDPGLAATTSEVQIKLSELINEIYVLLIRDAERRIEKVLDDSILEYSAIEGLSDLEMSDEWRLFRRKQNSSADRDLSPRRRRGASPRNITSLLSSTLYVLEAYAIHPTMIIQVFAQIIFWTSSELFNRILSNKKYLSRSKAMDLRMNISQIEEWIRANNTTWQNQPDLQTRCKIGLRPLVGLLQLLQCLSSLKPDEVKSVVDCIDGITARQALFVAERYRSERTETKIPRSAKISLATLEREQTATIPPDGEGIFLNASEQFVFIPPTSTDLILSYGSGIGGTQRDNEKLFTPTLPIDLIEKLDGDTSISAIDRAKGYTEGVGIGVIDIARLSADRNSKDYETLQREEEEERIANLVGGNSGVW